MKRSSASVQELYIFDGFEERQRRMTREEAIARLKLDRDLCNFNPMTGEEEPMNEDCRKSAEALDIAIKALEQEPCDCVSREENLPYKTGKWVYSGSYDKVGILYCSNCKHEVDVSEFYFKYCPNCGARMDEDERTLKYADQDTMMPATQKTE